MEALQGRIHVAGVSQVKEARTLALMMENKIFNHTNKEATKWQYKTGKGMINTLYKEQPTAYGESKMLKTEKRVNMFLYKQQSSSYKKVTRLENFNYKITICYSNAKCLRILANHKFRSIYIRCNLGSPFPMTKISQ